MNVRVEKNGPVTTLIIDRPEVRNAVDRPTADALAVEEAPVVAGAMTFQVVPNPARAGSVSLRLSDALRRHARSVRVVDALGAVILEMRLSPEPGAPGFDISGLAAGAYFVQVTHDGGIVGEKLVIER